MEKKVVNINYEATSNEKFLFKCNIFISARNIISTLCNIKALNVICKQLKIIYISQKLYRSANVWIFSFFH